MSFSRSSLLLCHRAGRASHVVLPDARVVQGVQGATVGDHDRRHRSGQELRVHLPRVGAEGAAGEREAHHDGAGRLGTDETPAEHHRGPRLLPQGTQPR